MIFSYHILSLLSGALQYYCNTLVTQATEPEGISPAFQVGRQALAAIWATSLRSAACFLFLWGMSSLKKWTCVLDSYFCQASTWSRTSWTKVEICQVQHGFMVHWWKLSCHSHGSAGNSYQKKETWPAWVGFCSIGLSLGSCMVWYVHPVNPVQGMGSILIGQLDELVTLQATQKRFSLANCMRWCVVPVLWLKTGYTIV